MPHLPGAAWDAAYAVVRTWSMVGDRVVPGLSSRAWPVLMCWLVVACGSAAAAGHAGPSMHQAPARPLVPDYIGRYATAGALADGGSVRLLSNGGVKLGWGRSARLLRVRPWGRLVVSCTRRTPAAAFRLSTAARGESAFVQTVARRVGRPLGLV